MMSKMFGEKIDTSTYMYLSSDKTTDIFVNWTAVAVMSTKSGLNHKFKYRYFREDLVSVWSMKEENR